MAFMNTLMDNATLEEVVAHIEECIAERRVGQVITPNVDQIVRCEWDSYFKDICKSCELLLVDGHPLIWIAKLYGRPFKEKICGADLILSLCGISAQKGYSIFLLGAAPGVAALAAEKLKARHPGLKIAGAYSPPLGFEKDEKEIERMNRILFESKADLLFVGMGVPKQDIFIYENMHKYQIPLSFSVGGAIDFIAGKQRRAPKWIGRLGYEWLFRFFCNPRRLFRRYFIDDAKILFLAWKYRNNCWDADK
jgi:N-acetylglucosaminyldiphosphoundecaprenol N-acetyl-beta-D-mannosaminyltransferase